MKIYFTIEASMEVMNKISIITELEHATQNYFEDKSYSEDLEYLFIGLFCMSPKFEPFFAPRKPKYTSETKKYIHRGVELEKKAKTYEYEIRLDFKLYDELSDIKPRLANHIINSLDNLLLTKKIKNLDLIRFKEDFNQFFKEVKWI